VAVGAPSAFVAIGAKAAGVIDFAEFRDAATGAVATVSRSTGASPTLVTS